MNKQEIIMRQLVEHVDKVCKENNITVFMSVSVEEERDGEIYQISSNIGYGSEGRLRRLIETTIEQSEKFRAIIVKTLIDFLR